MIIQLPDLQSDRATVYIGGRARESTATSAVLISKNTLVACHFNGCAMFLVNFDIDSGSYEIRDQIQTEFNHKKTETDLMCWDGKGNIATTNFFFNNCSFYRYQNGKLFHSYDSKYSAGNHVHGIKFYSPDVICMTSRKQHGGIYFIHRLTHQPVYRIGLPGLSVQDMCFLSPNRVAVISCHGSPQLSAFDIYSSVIHIVDFAIGGEKANVARVKEIPESHLDNIVCYQRRLYVTDQYNNQVIVLDAESLDEVERCKDFDFPHGVDANFGLLATTNYGNNTIDIRAIQD